MENKIAPPPYSPPGVAPPAGFTQQPGFAQQPGFSQQPTFVQQPQTVLYHPPAENTVIITNGPMVISSFGPSSQFVTCPSCHSTTTTRVDTEPSTKTHLFALFLCLFGCWPCCLVPYCMDSCQSKNHYCPHCGRFLGTYDD